MNMERAKNIIIALLIALNAVFGYLIYLQRSGWILTAEQSETIRSVLGKNNILLYEMPLTDYSPRKQLTIEAVEISDEAVEALFFGGNETEKTAYGDAVYFERDGFVVSRSGAYVDFYRDERDEPSVAITNAYAISVCDAFVAELGALYPELRFTRDHFNAPDAFRRVAEYSARVGDAVMYSGSARFTVTSDGLTEARCSFFRPGAFTGDAREIYSCAEALFQLMYRVKNDNGDAYESVTVTKIDLVYAQEEKNGNAVPFYRFYVRPGGNAAIRLEPYLVNAYSNTILN